MKFLLLLLAFACAQTPTPKRVSENPIEVSGPIAVLAGEDLFSARSTLPWAIETARVASCVMRSEAFLAKVASYQGYTHTKLNGAEIADKLRALKPVVIRTYKTKSKSSPTVAYRTGREPQSLYFNTHKQPRKLHSNVNTAIHEASHTVGLSHLCKWPCSSNDWRGKQNSPPYWVGKAAEEFVGGCQ